jgi:hypothetical protein
MKKGGSKQPTTRGCFLLEMGKGIKMWGVENE